jgi:hypothetical protein
VRYVVEALAVIGALVVIGVVGVLIERFTQGD